MINLVPDKYKKELRNQARQRVILGIENYLSVLSALCLIAVISINIFLQADLEFQKATLYGYKQGDEIVKLDEKISNINASASVISKFKGERVSQLSVLEKVSSRLVDGLKIQSIASKKQKELGVSTVKINGLAKDNSSLLAFREKLEGDKDISKLIFPEVLFLKEKDISFEITFDYKRN
jgi:hypothetical protein